MSFYLLRDEYNISVEKTATWNIFGGVSKEFTFKWNLFLKVSKEFTNLVYILGYVTKEFTFLYDVWYYVSREFTISYRIAMDYTAKVKYSFFHSPIVTRYFRSNRNG